MKFKNTMKALDYESPFDDLFAELMTYDVPDIKSEDRAAMGREMLPHMMQKIITDTGDRLPVLMSIADEIQSKISANDCSASEAIIVISCLLIYLHMPKENRTQRDRFYRDLVSSSVCLLGRISCLGVQSTLEAERFCKEHGLTAEEFTTKRTTGEIEDE